jgi:hypothetical protein
MTSLQSTASLFTHLCVNILLIGQETILLYANRHDIRAMGLKSRHHQPIIEELLSAVAIDYDYAEGKIYWSDVALEKLMWYGSVMTAVVA